MKHLFARFPALLPALALIVGSLSLSSGSSLAKQLFPLVGAQGATSLRTGLAALVLLAIWRPWRHRLAPRDLRNIALYGASLGMMNLFFYLALRTVPLGIVIAIEFMGPLAVGLAASRKRSDVLWIGIAVLGLLLLLPLAPGAKGLDPVGAAFAAAAGACWGLYVIFGQRAGSVSGGQATSLGMLVAALVVVPVGLAEAGTALFQPAILLLGLGVAILSSAIPFSLDMFTLKRLPKPTYGVLVSLEPALGALVALIILGERLTPLQWVAVLCIMTASIGSTLSFKPAKAALEPA